MNASLPETDLTRLLDTWRQDANELRESGDTISANQVTFRADELQRTLEEMLSPVLDPEATEQRQVDLVIARRRVDESAERLALSYPAEQRQRAAELLADLWTVIGDYDVTPVDLLNIADLGAVALHVVRLADRRAGR